MFDKRSELWKEIQDVRLDLITHNGHQTQLIKLKVIPSSPKKTQSTHKYIEHSQMEPEETHVIS